MRICCLNNYPLDKMLEMARDGRIPGQHGWGVQHLRAAGHDVRVAPQAASGDRNLLLRMSTASRHLLGQLDQELWALRQRPDLIYAADQHSLAGVAMARDMVARRTRMVSVIHHPMNGRNAKIRAAAIRAHDTVVTLTPAVCQELTDAGIDARFLPWGPDLRCGLYNRSSDEGYVISTGKSNRDVATLVAALAKTGQDGRVFDIHRTVAEAPGNVVLVHPGGDGADPEASNSYLAQPVLDQSRAAAFIAIPIADPDRLTGLTEINDAFALGKPIVITRSKYTPVDVEAIGCGIVVEAGDVDGWVAALGRLQDPVVRREMGARGRRFAETSWNYDTFGTELRMVIEEVGSVSP